MTLQEHLDAHKARAQARRTPEELETLERAVGDLRRSGILAGVPKVGEPAPDFILPDTQGQPVDSRELRRRGPLVVSFYRGKW